MSLGSPAAPAASITTSGRAAMRAFRQPGFLKKMRRTSAVSTYGLRTVLSGTLLPARPMGTSFKDRFRAWRDQGFEVSPHGYDHILWHDEAAAWSRLRERYHATGPIVVRTVGYPAAIHDVLEERCPHVQLHFLRHSRKDGRARPAHRIGVDGDSIDV